MLVATDALLDGPDLFEPRQRGRGLKSCFEVMDIQGERSTMQSTLYSFAEEVEAL
jgi:hypothetical protein